MGERVLSHFFYYSVLQIETLITIMALVQVGTLILILWLHRHNPRKGYTVVTISDPLYKELEWRRRQAKARSINAYLEKEFGVERKRVQKR